MGKTQQFSYKEVNSSESLERLCQFLSTQEYVFLDTEFERRNTFFPIPALLQIMTGKEIFLIDPTKLKNMDLLFQSLSKKVVLMHACREDLEVFREMSDYRIKKLIDTQVAAAILGYDTQLSYQNLVKNFVGVELAKTETCSDWLERPLSEEQIEYAIDDVFYLEKAWTFIKEKLIASDRLDWLNQEMQFFSKLIKDTKDSQYVLKMKGLGRMNSHQLSMIYDLCLWREKKAKQKNRPRSYIIKDKDIINFVKELPKNRAVQKSDIFASTVLPKHSIRKYSSEINAILMDPECSQEKTIVVDKIKRQLPVSSKTDKQNLKLSRDKKAEYFGVKPDFLLSSRLMDEALSFCFFDAKNETKETREVELTSILQAWRYDIFCNEFKNIINQYHD